MKILVTGGTGFVGGALTGHLARAGHEVLVPSRSAHDRREVHSGIRLIEGDPNFPGEWQDAAAEVQAVVNLAGASIFTRWTGEARQRIIDSRLDTTRHLVQALARQPDPDKVLLNASAVGYYGFRGDEDLDESGRPGHDFLSQVTQAWEAEALKAEAAGVRVGLMRFGVVLAPDGGALGRMLPLFRRGLGGPLGRGRQWFSWIHRQDLIRATLLLLERPEASGAFNFTAPNPIRNKELARVLGRVLKRPAFLPAPAFMIKLVLGEFGSVLLEGQKVLPRRLSEMGFEFRFPEINQALEDILRA
ncbi:MAG: TIGR01777 family oxidoreductase [Thermodesulfobacteriota bacterium]